MRLFRARGGGSGAAQLDDGHFLGSGGAPRIDGFL